MAPTAVYNRVQRRGSSCGCGCDAAYNLSKHHVFPGQLWQLCEREKELGRVCVFAIVAHPNTACNQRVR